MAKNQNNPKSNTEFPQTNTPQIKALNKCMITCSACSKRCLDEGHEKTADLCHQCIDVCALAIKSCCQESEFADQILELCSTVCSRCADECEEMNVPHCKECAEACRDCAEACNISAYSLE